MTQVPAMIALMGLPFLLFSKAEFWHAQNMDGWSASEIKRLVTDSPWARPVMLRVKGEDFAEGKNAIGPANPSSSESSPLAGTDLSGRMGNPANRNDEGSVPAGQSIVRWDSALPMREACAKAGFEQYAFSCYSKLMYLSGQTGKFDDLAKNFYILTISSYPKAALSRRDQEAPQHSPSANAALERLGDRLKATTILKRKDKENIAPEKVLVLPAGQSLLVVVFFSRATSLYAQDGSIIFESINDPVAIKTRFNLSKMTYKGRLEL